MSDAAAIASHRAFVRMTEMKKSLKITGASRSSSTQHAVDREALQPGAARDGGAHAGLPNSPSGRKASTITSSAKVSRIE